MPAVGALKKDHDKAERENGLIHHQHVPKEPLPLPEARDVIQVMTTVC